MALNPSRLVGRDLLLLIALPVLYRLPELTGWLHSSPRLLLSGLGVGLRAGVLPGLAGMLDPNSGWTTESLGHLAAQEWLAGRLPWWNPYSGVGAPLAAEMQPAALFLPFVLLLHFGNGLVLLRLAMQILAGIGAYGLTRAMGLSRPACVVAGVLYGFCGAIVWFSHGPDRVAAFLPWMLWAIELCRDGARRRVGGTVFAIAVAFSILAGFPECAYINGLLALAWFGWRGVQAGGERAGLCGSVMLGGVCGLLLAAPAIWPFVQYLRFGEVGLHDGASFIAPMSPTAAAILVSPYLAGPIASFAAVPGQPMFGIWGTVGGYLGAATVALALVGALAGRRERGLRWMLLGFVVVAVGKAMDAPGLAWLVDRLPLLSRTVFDRYMVAALTMACGVIGAVAIDDWLGRRLHARRSLGVAIAGVVLLAGLVLHAWPVLSTLRVFPTYDLYLRGSIGWSAALLLAIPMLMAGAPRPWRRFAVIGLVGLDALAMAGLTLLSSPLAGRVDAAPADFVRRQPGYGRVLSVAGGFGLNEGAYEGFGGLNETMLPTPALWGEFLRRTIDPAANPISFPDRFSLNDAAARLPALRELGVAYIATARHAGPAHAKATVGSDAPRRPLALGPGRGATGWLPAGLLRGGGPVVLGIDIGTYGGASDGRLVLRVCGGGECVTGSAALALAIDNTPVDIVLDHAPGGGDCPMRWTLRHDGGVNPVAIWLFGGSGAAADGGADGPRFSTARPIPGLESRPAKAVDGIEIYQLTDPLPYVQAAPGCAVVLRSREVMHAACAGAGVLMRRELFFPGWRARVNGAWRPVRRQGLFQALELPPGGSEIVFRYAPPGIGWAWLGCGAGAMILAGCFARVGAVTPPPAPPSKGGRKVGCAAIWRVCWRACGRRAGV